jgi:glycosyltransferase involved in cell wall biosynthesis
MVKVIIQIPCWNEQATLPQTLKDLPKFIEGVDILETLVIDDGSDDLTVEVAKKHGVNHIVKLNQHRGLAHAFSFGLDTSLKLGADIIVNTDADNQYCGEDVEKLLKPILEHRADIVIGNRNVETIKHFSWIKKKLQKIGSWVVKVLSGTEVLDATSGFRAFSKEAALRMNVISSYTYSLETIIQAGQKQLRIEFVDVRTNKKLRASKLMPNIFTYLIKSAITIFRIFSFYQPLKVFAYAGSFLFGCGIFLGLRYLYHQFFISSNEEHFASLFLCIAMLIMGFLLFMMGILGDQIATNRYLLEDTLLKVRKLELNHNKREEQEENKKA